MDICHFNSLHVRLMNIYFISVPVLLCSTSDFAISFVELGVAIIVCSAPAFSSFARSHLAKSPVIRLLHLTFSCHHCRRRMDPSDSTSTRSEDRYNIHTGDKLSNGIGRDTANLDHSHRYIELNETGTVESWAAVDQDTLPRATAATVSQNGIVIRT
jgi:hypothetical protein